VIHVERSGIPVPDWFLSPAHREAVERARFHFSQPIESRRQAKFEFFELDRLRGVLVKSLHELFRSKCAYCETLVHSDGAIDHFRPRMGVSEDRGSYLGDHYWAQAFEWENMYLVCPACNRAKGNRFPVDGQRAGPDADRTALLSERALLLDPCKDQPYDHLLFDRESAKVLGKTDQGRATIEVLGLNRKDLLKERASVVLEFDALAYARGSTAGIPSDWDGPDQAFRALRRQLLEELTGGTDTRRSASATSDQASYDRSRESFSSETASGLENLRSRARYIDRVRICNFAGIHDLDLQLNRSKSHRAGWLALLGENGVGKSSVLRAIALTLAGSAYRQKLKIRPRDILSADCDDGFVEVQLSGSDELERMSYRRNDAHFESERAESRSLILAYGATRLLPKPRSRTESGFTHARVENMFNPFFPLTHASRWLNSIDQAQFDVAARALKGLLNLPESAVLERDGRQVYTRTGNQRSPIHHLSEGFQSMIGLSVDITRVLLSVWPAMESAEGVVLIDELGNHFHPRWKMRVVGALREAFPRVQFIVSTHDPLCLRGLEDGEVAVLRRDGDGDVYALTQLPSVKGLRVDQLLTSEHFGLMSAVDPEIEEKFERYYLLLAKRDKSADEESTLSALRAELNEYRLPAGSSLSQRLMLKAIDDHLAREPEVKLDVERVALDESLKANLREILGSAGAFREDPDPATEILGAPA
jgi:uncharacterized protein (TIGR02646 family)